MKFRLTPLMEKRRRIRIARVNKRGMRILENVWFDKGTVYDTEDFKHYPQFNIKQYTEQLHKRKYSVAEVKKHYSEASINVCKGCGGIVTGYTVPVFEEVK